MTIHPDCAKYESLIAAIRNGQNTDMNDYEENVFLVDHMKHCPTGYHTRKGLDQENFLQDPTLTDPQVLSALKQRILQSLQDKLKEK